jgi:hypothetical protein
MDPELIYELSKIKFPFSRDLRVEVTISKWEKYLLSEIKKITYGIFMG